MEKRFENITNDVLAEIKKQDEKWGANREKHPLEWQCILLEEVGEVAKEICDSNFHTAKLEGNYRAELIQVAAVTLQAILDYDN